MPTVTLTVGISASGKTTWARQMASRTGAVVVSRDDIRIAQGLLFGDDEDFVTKISYMNIKAAVESGYDVIVADTNLSAKFRNDLIAHCQSIGAEVRLKVLNIDLCTAIMRDKGRVASVGEKVIRNQYEMFVSQDLYDSYIPSRGN